MAKDDGNGAPGDRTNSFDQGDRTIHCVATLKQAKSGTQMRFSWWIVDAEGTTNQKDQRHQLPDESTRKHRSWPSEFAAGLAGRKI